MNQSMCALAPVRSRWCRRLLFLGAFLAGCGSERGQDTATASPATEERAEEPVETGDVEEAEPDEVAAPEDEARIAARGQAENRARAHRDHLAAGRRAAATHDYEVAVRELEAAADASPHHAPTLGELGFVLLRAGQLSRADRLTRRALSMSTAARRRAPLLYNLGRIAEAREDVEGARERYAESLRLRPNRVVRERLRALGGGQDARAPVFSAVLGSAQGPFDTLDALCEELYERDRTQPPFDGACELQGEWLGEGLRWGVIHASFEIGYATVYLVLRADAGFFVGAELGFIEEDSRTEQGWVGDIEAVAVDLIDGAPEELTLVWSSGSGFENGCHWRTSARRRALVCAAVEAGAGCFATMDLGPVTYEGQGMAPIAVSLGECEPDDDFADVSENDDAPSYTVSFEPGRITVGGGGGSDDPRVGTHSAVRAFCGLRSAPSSLSCAN